MTATFAQDYRIIDLRRTDYEVVTHPLSVNHFAKVVAVVNALTILLGYLQMPQVDIVRTVTNLLLEIDLVFIQSAYYLSKLTTNLFGYLIFGLDMQ